jgi:SAM-dependent methyltransferase
MGMDKINRKTYGSFATVRYYAKFQALFPPEQTILRLLEPDLRGMKMLDVGVGGGRTTPYFAPLVKEYVGIDYSPRMIAACQKKMKQYSNVAFKVCDARSMDVLADDSFDFVLVSLNGLDYISHGDRLRALREIKRVIREGGVLGFSSHNLLVAKKIFTFKWSLNPIRLWGNFLEFLLLRMMNNDIKGLDIRDYAVINDGAHFFRLRTYFIKPTYQLTQLHELGFQQARIFSLVDGQEVAGKIDSLSDYWLYYLCTAGQ